MGNTSEHIHVRSEISFAESWRLLISNWKIICFLTLLATAIALTASFIVTPVYRATVLMSPSSAESGKDRLGGLSGLASQYGGLASLAGVSLGQNGDKAVAIATLQSRILTQAYIREENLLPILFPNKWDQRAGKWKDLAQEKIPTLWDGNELFEKKIRKTSLDKQTGLVTLTIDWSDPQQAAQWANDLVKRANSYLRDLSIQESNRNIAYLQRQLTATSIVEIQQSISLLLGSEIKTAMLAQGNDEYALHIIDPAVPPQERYFPKRGLFVLFGMVLGIMGSSLFILIRHSIRNGRG